VPAVGPGWLGSCYPGIHVQRTLPRGIGLNISGTVGGLERVDDIANGELVLRRPLISLYSGAGISAPILTVWAPVPEGLNPFKAAALPMVVETASCSAGALGVVAGRRSLINGGGTMTGFAAVQIN